METARFSKVHIEISNICNLQCSFCPEVVREKKLMDPALFRRVIAEVAPITDQVALHLMGDPLVHPQLPELVDLVEALGSKIFLVTNGTLLREDRAELLLRSPFRQVNFSLHSFPDNFPDRDPGPYLERIFLFTERALRERPDLYVNFRLWNLDGPAGAGARNEAMLEAVEKRFGVSVERGVDVRQRKGHRLLGRLYLHFDTEFTWPSLELPLRGSAGTCYGLSTHFGVLVDGTVVPCCLDKEGSIPLGNLQDTPLAEILAGERARKMREGFARGRLEEDLCQRCSYISRFAKVKATNSAKATTA